MSFRNLGSRFDPWRSHKSLVMFFTYVLKSLSHDYFYKGHCQDLEQRIKQHNRGKTKSIKAYRPFKIVYFETFNSRKEAVLREKYFKTAAGRRFLKKVIPKK